LKDADYSQNAGENADDPGPSDHSAIKGIIFFIIIVFGTWLGVWSAVFWDWLGGWRWVVCAAGFAAVIVSVFQGLPAHL
jgi:hypothetical protein